MYLSKKGVGSLSRKLTAILVLAGMSTLGHAVEVLDGKLTGNMSLTSNYEGRVTDKEVQISCETRAWEMVEV
jgi:hypothetical protein